MTFRKSRKNKKKKSILREYTEAIIIAILLALFIRTFIVQAFKIPSGSMIPTLLVGDHIIVNKFIYGVKMPFINKTLIPVSSPKRNDVIVFIYPVDHSKDFIKRAIGLPGDRIRIIGQEIYINDKLFDDQYGMYDNNMKTMSLESNKQMFTSITVPENHLFVMGDNRDHSYDSRFWGFVPLEYVKGKAMIVYWSWPHWKRFINLIR